MLKQFLHKGMKGFAISLLLAIAMVVGMAVSSDARLASTNRRAVVLEAYYALNPAYYGFSSKLINGSFVSDWGYLATDLNAYNKEKGYYGRAYSSVFDIFFANIGAYSFMGNYGRGAQCKYFVDTLLYRSEAASRFDNSDRPTSMANGTHALPTYSTMSTQTRYIGHAKPGDVIFIPYVHTALVVAVLAGDPSSGTVTEVDVIDSNVIGGKDNEIIGRHRIKVTWTGGASDLNAYKIYTGVSYYGENY